MLASYIFNGDGIGAQFVDALARAAQRGVEVRVLIDDVDVRFTRRSAAKPLSRAGVRVGIFNPPIVPARMNAVHLRNHRKILVVDGALGFTGGMNIDRRYWNSQAPAEAYRDLHFRMRGPVVAQLGEVFADDWQFATGEALRGAPWFVPLEAAGDVLARCIDDGPDDSAEPLRWSIVGGLNQAQRSVRVLTPYFVPDGALITAVDVAAMRGVEVDIVLPARSDLPHVHWAAWGQLWQVLERGCRIWSSAGPFDHSKLMVVDGAWTLLGSANWDARSLRLNFELNVECYSVEFGARMDGLVQARINAAQRVTMDQVNARSLPVKLRDGVARLFAPFLPFATEEVWSWWRTGSVHRAAWPAALEIADGDTAMLGTVGIALSGIRKAKSEAKVKQRTEVLTATITATGPLVAQLRAGLNDLKAAANAQDIVLETGDGELTVSDVVLVPAEENAPA